MGDLYIATSSCNYFYTELFLFLGLGVLFVWGVGRCWFVCFLKKTKEMLIKKGRQIDIVERLEQTWIQRPALPFINYMMLGKLLNISEPNV